MYYTLKGKRRAKKRYTEARNSSLWGSQAKLDFLLLYLKHNPNQSYHGCMFDMCQAKVSEWVHFLCPVLETALTKLRHMPQTGSVYQHFRPDDKGILADVTERAVPRRSSYQAQKEEYSHRGSGGKKKLHTVKNLAITDLQGYCLFLSDTYEGCVHDKTLWDELSIDPKNCPILADLGFLGADKDCPSMVLPYKKPKGGELSELQQQINKSHSTLRVTIEHTFSGIKRLKIVRNKIRLKSYEIREQVIKIATGLHNLRLAFRKPLLNYS